MTAIKRRRSTYGKTLMENNNDVENKIKSAPNVYPWFGQRQLQSQCKKITIK
jgi:hypothetical protein